MKSETHQKLLALLRPDSSSRLARNLQRFSILLVCTVSLALIAASVVKITRQALTPGPIDMWEAASVSVAARVAKGESMYQSLNEPRGIEPGLYSPLQPLTLAALFRVTGPGLAPARVINLLAGIIFIVVFIRAMGVGRNAFLLLFATALLLAIDRQLTGLWDFPRGDAVALLASLLYVCAAYRACNGDSFRWALCAHLVLLIGFFWKQTVAFIAFAPFLAALITPGCSPRMRLLFLFGPFVVLAGSSFLVSVLNPNLFDAMFRFGSKYMLQPRNMILHAYGMLLSTPLLWMTAWWMVLSRDFPGKDDARIRWALAAVAASLPLNFMAAGKVGGGQNSLAHVMYGLGAVVIWCAPAFYSFLQTASFPVVRRCLFGVLLSLALIVEWTSVLHTPSRVKLSRPFADAGRRVVIETVRRLPGRVVSPQDPTIAMEAKGYIGVASVNEWDRHTWKWPLPKTLLEIQAADYVVTFGKGDSLHLWTFNQGYEQLPSLGFEVMEVPGLENSEYTIWKRIVPKQSLP